MDEMTQLTFRRVLVFVAHPDDEAIACGALLQRASASLVVFATDGAAPHYGFERKFGSLQKYSAERFREAAQALALIPNCLFRRLLHQNGTHFQDQHLFLDLVEAFMALCQAIRAFAPDVLVSHAYEGGHIDHDACNFLAARAAVQLGLQCLEFPLYSKSADGGDVFQHFRNTQPGEFTLQLSAQELSIKRRMFAAYRTQEKVLAVFRAEDERFRPALAENYAQLPSWREYPFENRHKPLRAEVFIQKLAEFKPEPVVGTAL
jgi:N-acetylglucosamine malate deacetylase 2